MNFFLKCLLFVYCIVILLLHEGFCMNASNMHANTENIAEVRNEVAALLAWKSSFDKESQSLLSSWAAGSKHCKNWLGIGCNTAGRVESIFLRRFGITGKLDKLNFSSFPCLISIDLYNNSFSGTIPSNIGKVSRLRFLNFANNDLSGTLPPQIGKLVHVRYFNLSMNHMNGSIPQEIGLLKYVVGLDLGSNDLVGSIPTSIGNFRYLERLFLHENKLSGCIPSSIGNLTRLHNLKLRNNELSGQIPPQLGKLHSLARLSLSWNKLKGTIPPELNNITRLVILSLGHNNLHGNLPENICLGGLLYRFAVEQNNFSGNILKNLNNCTSLNRIRVDGNKFSGNISEDFGVYPNLVYIDLSHNKFHGELPSNWGRFKKLTSLKFSNNKISSKIPTELGEASQLQRLDLSSNQLFGSIPRSLGNLTSLLELKLNHNKLSGNIPFEIGKLSRLSSLSLSTNNLIGTVPQQLGYCMQLVDLNLSQNMLGESIPYKIGYIPTLGTLDLSSNMFTGEIPSQLGQLPSIEKLNLSHNQISGTIPSSFGQLYSLISIDISYNQLEGPLPNIAAVQKAPFEALRNNKALCGNILGLNPCIPSVLSKGNKSRRSTKTILVLVLLPILASIFLLTLMIVGIFLLRKKNIISNHENEPRGENLFAIWSFDGKMVYKNIIEATEDFIPSHCIGHGGHGSVYKAELPDGQIVAVKKLHALETSGSGLNIPKCFISEVKALTKLRHRNIVKLHGFCSHARHSFLVYEFLEGGNLHDMLASDEKATGFPWIKRVNLVKDVGNALSYMHHDFSHSIVHRDISSKNVLLDSEQIAHISDFGTARFLRHDTSHLTSFVGTQGYAAPEYAYSTEANTKSDVYSFGILALEVIMGKHPRDLISSIFFESSSSSLVINRHTHLKDIIDQRLSTPIDKVENEVVLVLKIALSCVQHSPQSRPTMQQICKVLSNERSPFKDGFSCLTLGQLLDHVLCKP